MNGKQAKRLRKAALGLTTTLVQSGKDIKKDGYVVQRHSNAFGAVPAPVVQADGTEVQANREPLPSYQLRVRHDSLKGIYKQLKRAA